MSSLTSFNPVNYSIEENEFLLKHLGEPPVVALRSIKAVPGPRLTVIGKPDKNPLTYPDGVAPSSVMPIIETVYEFLQLEQIEGAKWAGLDAIKSAIHTWLSQDAKWASDHKRMRNAPRYPSLYSYDIKGTGRKGGVGSDTGIVKTYFGPKGERIPFEITLLAEYVPEWTAPTMDDAPAQSNGLKVDSTTNRIECLVGIADGQTCGHTESFKPDSRASFNAARGRMSKHLRRAKQATEAHMELHGIEFGSGSVA